MDFVLECSKFGFKLRNPAARLLQHLSLPRGGEGPERQIGGHVIVFIEIITCDCSCCVRCSSCVLSCCTAARRSFNKHIKHQYTQRERKTEMEAPSCIAAGCRSRPATRAQQCAAAALQADPRTTPSHPTQEKGGACQPHNTYTYIHITQHQAGPLTLNSARSRSICAIRSRFLLRLPSSSRCS